MVPIRSGAPKEQPMSTLKGWFFVSLRKVEKSDAITLEKLYASKRFKDTCMYEPESRGSQFVAESESLDEYLYVQYLVLLGERAIGTIYAYGHDPNDGHTYISVYIEEMYEWFGCGAEAVAILVDHLFRVTGTLREVRFEVYEHSIHSLRCLRMFGLKEKIAEGILRQHEGVVSRLFVFTLLRRNLRKYISEAARRGIDVKMS
jgi:RimJ/RimL family protein N-acetyltransferase